MSKKDETREHDNILQQLCAEMSQNQTDIEKLADMNEALHSTVRSLEGFCPSPISSSTVTTAVTTAATTAATCGMSSYSVPKIDPAEVMLLRELRKDTDYIIRILSAERLSPFKAKDVLEEVIENITCNHECKSCKYYRPKAIDYCNTARRIADYIVDTGIVEVYEPETK